MRSEEQIRQDGENLRKMVAECMMGDGFECEHCGSKLREPDQIREPDEPFCSVQCEEEFNKRPKRRYFIGHYYGERPPVPEAIMIDPGDEKHAPTYVVDIVDLRLFVKEHGPIILSPPGYRPMQNDWFIWVTDHTGRFIQK